MNTNTDNRVFFTSQRAAARLGYAVSANIGKLATRIQRLANPPRGTTANPDMIHDTKTEIKSLIAQLVWGYDNLGEFMKPVEESIAEWCGGGYSRPRTDAELSQVAEALAISKEQAKLAAETNRLHSRDYLAIRRQGLAPIMAAKIEQLISQSDNGEPPSDDIIEKTLDAAFQNAVLWGDWAEAALIKDDMVYHLGKSPKMPEQDKSQADKAERIRESLASRQAEQAQRDAEALMSFDLDLAA